ncbi:MAG: VOC family protein [Xanthobacteraceae bacterium]|nr:VOC family protein [Xanthobacteraceae bacterium]
MDAASACFAALGFTLTPRGHHSLGSINHLMMTGGAYLELVGVPEEGLQRQEVLDSPYGVNGLVLRSDNADATFARLTEAGFPALAPGIFSRPVTIDGQTLDARFRTVRFSPETFSGGRVYFCEHLTPELVWRKEWLTHPNGFCGIDRFMIETPNAEADAGRYAAAFESRVQQFSAGWRVPLDDAEIKIIERAKSRFATVELVFENLDEIERRAGLLTDTVWQRRGAREATLALPAFDLNLTCRSSR